MPACRDKGDNGDKGDKGTDGTKGMDGKSIVWLGSFNSYEEIENPEYLNAYYNITDGCSYIYTGTEWTLLAKAGEKGDKGEKGDNGNDGISINWRGSFAFDSQITNPKELDAYYNTTDNCSYIYKGNKWTPLVMSFNYSVGDVLLNDGTIIHYIENKTTFTDEEKEKAIGVLYSLDDFGIPRGWLAIHNSAGGINAGKYAWEIESSPGYRKIFINNRISCRIFEPGDDETLYKFTYGDRIYYFD